VLLISGAWSLQGEPIRVGVSLLPLETLVREIGGDAVEVRSLQREGDSCSVFEPRPSSIAWLSNAKVFFRIGAGYETTIMGKLQSQYPEMRICDLREVVELVESEDSAHDHHHGHDHDEEAGSLHGEDPHVWLDPVRLMSLATLVADELGLLRPESRERFAKAASEYKSRLRDLNNELIAQLKSYDGRAFYIYHPALGYFADRYRLEQITIAEFNQGPSIKQLHQLISQAKRDRVQTIFVQPQESRRQAEILANAIGAELVEIDPMSVELESNLIKIGSALAESFRKD